MVFINGMEPNKQRSIPTLHSSPRSIRNIMAKNLMITPLFLALLILPSICNTYAQARPLTSMSRHTMTDFSKPAPLPSEESGSNEGRECEEWLIRRSLVAHTDYIYTQDTSELP